MPGLVLNSEWQSLLPFLTEQELDKVWRLLEPERTPEAQPELETEKATDRVVWKPNPGPQTQAKECQANELFYGGAAGGGKTDLLIGVSMLYHRKAIIFRREYPQLRAIIDRMRELAPPHLGRFNNQTGVFKLYDGRTVELGACQYDQDVSKYQGRPHDLKGFDEITHFTEYRYRFLNGWKRTADPAQRVRTIATGNPPTTAEGQWVIPYWGPWLDDTHSYPALPGELRWFAVLDREDVMVEGPEPFVHRGEVITPVSRTFIPARVEDNPFYMATGYKAQLQSLPEPLRSQMLSGDFKAQADDDPWQVIPTEWIRMAQRRWQVRFAGYDGNPMALGVDVARGGRDQTVIAELFERDDGTLDAPFIRYTAQPGTATPDGPAVAALVVGKVRGSPLIKVDIIGVGTSVYDILVRTRGLMVHGVNNSESAPMGATDRSGKLAFANMRAYSYWRLRERLDPVFGDDLALPPDDQVRKDLTAPRWMLTSRGIAVESKDQIIDRLKGHSPDIGDAIVLANLQIEPRRILLGAL